MIVAALIILGINVVNIQEVFETGNLSFLTFLPFLIAAILVIALISFFRKKLKSDYYKNIRFYKDVTFIFSVDGIFAKGEGFENRTPWNECEKITETDDWFLIYKSKYQYQIIDKKQIRDLSIDELRNFFESLEQKIRVSLK